MNAIETRFNNRQHKSRTEARYAVLFHACQLPYEYEKEGFWLELGRYLPDFDLPSLNLWFEVKGELPTSNAINLCHCLADETSKRVVMAYGSPGWGATVYYFFPGSDGYVIQRLPEFLMECGVLPEIVIRAIEIAQSARFEFGQTPNVVAFRQTQSDQVRGTAR